MVTPLARLAAAYQNRGVLITSNTGFKGSWLALRPSLLGTEGDGYLDSIPTKRSRFARPGLLHETISAISPTAARQSSLKSSGSRARWPADLTLVSVNRAIDPRQSRRVAADMAGFEGLAARSRTARPKMIAGQA